MPGSPSHLAARFFDVLFAKPLSRSETGAVAGWLGPAESEIFFAQSNPDQRHGYHASLVVVAAGIDEPTVIRAALLHDVGKRHARLGVIGRTIASVMIALHLPLPRRITVYRDHGEVGAEELAQIGCEPLIVDFARSHHKERPATIALATWDLLQLADQPAKPGPFARARIS